MFDSKPVPSRITPGGKEGVPSADTAPRSAATSSEAVETGANCLGFIAGNGRFPFLLLDAARAHGLTVIVAAIKEETDPEMDARAAADPAIRVHWLSLGELSKLIETFQAEGVTRAVMAGQGD